MWIAVFGERVTKWANKQRYKVTCWGVNKGSTREKVKRVSVLVGVDNIDVHTKMRVQKRKIKLANKAMRKSGQGH